MLPSTVLESPKTVKIVGDTRGNYKVLINTGPLAASASKVTAAIPTTEEISASKPTAANATAAIPTTEEISASKPTAANALERVPAFQAALKATAAKAKAVAAQARKRLVNAAATQQKKQHYKGAAAEIPAPTSKGTSSRI